MSDSPQSKGTHLAFKAGVEDQAAQMLIPILADTIFIYHLYKKYHWHVAGKDFYQYHLLFDKHAGEQLPLVDLIAERIRTLGTTAPAMPANVENYKTLDEPSDARQDPQAMLRNLGAVHEKFIKNLRQAIDKADDLDDEATEDILVSDVLRLHELQVWFIRSSLEE